MKPGYYEAWNNLAGSLAARSKLAEAENAYARALTLRPDYGDACLNYGLLLAEKLGNVDSALALIERGERLLPDGERKALAHQQALRLRLRTGTH
jgi:tetratricopeptide (TPR) repeat protein